MRNIIVTLVSMFFILNVSAQNKGFDFLQKKMYDGGKSNYVMIFAHRGNWRGAPENSLQAYKQCIDGGIDGVEIDVHMTKDSAIVMMHDDTVDRTTTGTGLVSDYTLEEIKKLNLKKYDEVDMAQMSLFDTVKDDDVLEELKSIDVGNLTPVDALNTIYRLQNKLKNRW
jgi:glycerophosphoryl diester phosphodiesterase